MYRLEKIIQLLPSINNYVEELVKSTEINQQDIYPCLRAHVFNSFMLYVASCIRHNRDIDLSKYSSKVKKSLSKTPRIKYLADLCRLYLELVSKRIDAVADIGCGLGLNLNIIKGYGSSSFLVGIDKDLYFLKILKRLLNDAEVVHADALMLPIRTSSIDIVFSTEVIHELPSLRVIDEFVRVLKNGGYLLLRDVVFRFIPSRVLSLIRSIRVKIGSESETPYTPKQIISKMESLNIVIEKSSAFWKLIIGVITVVAKKK